MPDHEPPAAAPGAVRIIPLGGTGEFGKNMTVLEMDGQMLVIDCGVTFPRHDQMGIDLVIPDFGYMQRSDADLVAVVFTHPHEDHIGALPFLMRAIGPVTVYAPRFTLGLVRSKLDEHGLVADAELIETGGGTRFDIGPFDVEFISLIHSVPDCVAVSISTPIGRIVHTGDFRYEAAPFRGEAREEAIRTGRHMDIPRLAQLGEEGVRLLLADSTNAEIRDAPPKPESAVLAGMRSLFASSDGRVIVTTFSSHVHRVENILKAAYLDGRSAALVGRSLVRNVNIALNLGYLEPPPGTLISPRELDQLPLDEQVLICTGSQGEPLAALSRMARGEHHQVQIQPDDTVVYSARTVPGNELAINETINRLRQVGARVITRETSGTTFHVSGHGSAWDIELMLQLLRPEHMAPIHGELRQQRAHAELASELGVADGHLHMLENGDVLEVTEDGVGIVGREEVGISYVDRVASDEVGEEVLRDRRHLSEDGLVLVVVSISASDGALTGEPDIVTRGMSGGENPDVLAETKQAVVDTLEESAGAKVTEFSVLQHRLHDAVAGAVKRSTGQRPIVLPVIVEV